MDTLAAILKNAGFAIYGIPLLLTAMNLLRVKRNESDLLGTIRAIRSVGPILGLALGATIFGGLWGIWLEYGSFDWPSDQRDSAALVTFFVMWVSNIKLEIWTLEPLRKLDPDPPAVPADMEAFLAAVQRYNNHLILHCAAIVGFAILSWT